MTVPAGYVPSPRSLLYVRPTPVGGGTALEIGCDCGTVTQLIVTDRDAEQLARDPQEVPFTCDGCMSTHWFTLGPAADLPDGPQ